MVFFSGLGVKILWRYLIKNLTLKTSIPYIQDPKCVVTEHADGQAPNVTK